MQRLRETNTSASVDSWAGIVHKTERAATGVSTTASRSFVLCQYRAMNDAIRHAQKRWPGIVCDEPELASLFGDAELPPFASEVVLARACVAGDPAAVRYFDAEMLARVDRVLQRLGLSAADADDIKQEIRAKLLLGGPEHAKLVQY